MGKPKDSCSACGGSGICESQPPKSENGAHVIRAVVDAMRMSVNGKIREFYVEGQDPPEDDLIAAEMNRLSALGYELFAHHVVSHIEMFVMRWHGHMGLCSQCEAAESTASGH